MPTATRIASAGQDRQTMLGSSGLFGDENEVWLVRSLATSRVTTAARFGTTTTASGTQKTPYLHSRADDQQF